MRFILTLLVISSLGGWLSENDAAQLQTSGRFDHDGLRYAARVKAAKPEDSLKEIEQQCKTIDAWLTQLKTARSEKYRSWAARALLRIAIAAEEKDGSELTTDERNLLRKGCLELHSSLKGEQREDVIVALVKVADKSCLPVLHEILINDSSENITYTILRKLPEFRDESSIKAVDQTIRKLASELPIRQYKLSGMRDESVILRAVDVLYHNKTKAARDALEALHTDLTNAEWKEWVAQALDLLDEEK